MLNSSHKSAEIGIPKEAAFILYLYIKWQVQVISTSVVRMAGYATLPENQYSIYLQTKLRRLQASQSIYRYKYMKHTNIIHKGVKHAAQQTQVYIIWKRNRDIRLVAFSIDFVNDENRQCMSDVRCACGIRDS